MSWNLQQINNPTGQPAVPGESVACSQAPAASVSPPFVCTFEDQQHFAYIDRNGNVQDCWYDGAANRWNLQQINNATGQPTVPGEYVACPQATAAANGWTLFVCTFADQQHFAYLDGNGNIQDCWYDGAANRWNLQQITGGQPTVPGEYVPCPEAPATLVGGPFVCTFGDQQHFAYIDRNLNIQDCWYDGAANRWNLQQINNATAQPTVPGEYVACPQATAAATGGTLFVCTFGDQQHYTYQDANFNIQDCWYDGATNRWNLQQITGGQPTVPGEYLACPQAPATQEVPNQFVCAFGDQLHIAYPDGNLNIQDCWYDGAANRWNLQQITGGQPAVPGEYLACAQAPSALSLGPLVSAFGDQQHFAYIDGNNNIQDCWYDGAANRWNLQQITGGQPTVPGEYVACPQAPAATGRGLFVSTFKNQQHFTYLDGYTNIQDCWWG